jgi:4a-hydroxytetrahydrobiopterin dehydratase
MSSDFSPQQWQGASRVQASAAEVSAFVKAHPGWQSDGKSLYKDFRFANHFEAMAFANAVAWIAHRQDHHPEQRIGYNTVALRWDTHDVGGISATDFHCARACDALLRA